MDQLIDIQQTSAFQLEQHENQMSTLNEEKEHMEDELNRLISIVQEQESTQNNHDGARSQLEMRINELEEELEDSQRRFIEHDKNAKSLQATQILQINDLNKKRMQYESELENVKANYNSIVDQNQDYEREIKQQNDIIKILKSQNEILHAKQLGDEKEVITALEHKLSNLSDDLESKDQKYTKVMEKLREVQKECKQKDTTLEFMQNSMISKTDHETELEQLKSDNAEMQKKIKKLLQQIEMSKMEEKNRPATPSQSQILAFKEYTEITKRVMKYDIHDHVKNNQKRVTELVIDVLGHYDTVNFAYQAVEQQLIDTKLKHAEAVEAKERLQIELDAVHQYYTHKYGESLDTVDEEEQPKTLKKTDSDGLFAKATNLFSSASSFYSGRFN